MARIGYALSSEEHEPRQLVENARAAEEAGFEFALISDHYHPWIDAQGHSPFVWSILGGIANATSRLEVGTGVTCPMIRIHPAIIAQAAATIGCLMPGRFFLGVGTGENLNEHILGDKWPEYEVRAEMLEEAIDVIRQLWQRGPGQPPGPLLHGRERAHLRPPGPAAADPRGGRRAARRRAGRADRRRADHDRAGAGCLEAFRNAGGSRKPMYGQVTLCWAESRDEAVRTAHRIWPTAGHPREASQELPVPAHFEQLARW